MKSKHVARAGVSLCSLVLIGVLSVPLLLWPRISLAYFTVPLQPLFLAQSSPDDGCFGGTFFTTNTQYTPCGGTIGYVFNTQAAGTVPFYQWAVPDPDSGGCFGGGGVSANPPYMQCARLIGYLYPSQVSGTSPLYFYSTPDPDSGACIYSGGLSTNPPYMQCAQFVGYVYTSIPGSNLSTLQPLYVVGSVIYMPPGASGSFVQYGTNTTVGTTLTIENSFTFDASATLDPIDNLGGGSVTLGDSFGGTDSTSTDMQSSSMRGTKFTAPASNPINHDFDQVVLYLGVFSNISIDYLGHVTQSFDFSRMASMGFPSIGYFAKVGCLNSNSSIYTSLECQSERDQLAAPGWDIHSDSYPDILAADPFWDPNNQPFTLDPCRFKPVEQEPSVPYEVDAGVVPGLTNTNSLNITNSVTVTDSHFVSFTVRGGVFDFARLSVTGKLTITNKSTTSNHTGNTDMSTFSITMPAAPYNGPGSLNIYVDTIYKTFMFSFMPPPAPGSPQCTPQ